MTDDTRLRLFFVDLRRDDGLFDLDLGLRDLFADDGVLDDVRAFADDGVLDADDGGPADDDVRAFTDDGVLDADDDGPLGRRDLLAAAWWSQK